MKKEAEVEEKLQDDIKDAFTKVSDHESKFSIKLVFKIMTLVFSIAAVAVVMFFVIGHNLEKNYGKADVLEGRKLYLTSKCSNGETFECIEHKVYLGKKESFLVLRNPAPKTLHIYSIKTANCTNVGDVILESGKGVGFKMTDCELSDSDNIYKVEFKLDNMQISHVDTIKTTQNFDMTWLGKFYFKYFT